MSTSIASPHYHLCNLCPSGCGLEIDCVGETILAIRGDAQDPFSQGHICPKGVALQDLHRDPDRLRQPLERVEGTWREISWEQALETTASELHRMQQKYGRDAVGIYLGNPTVHNFAALLYLPLLNQVLGTRNHYSATSLDQLPHMFAALQMFGHQALLPTPDFERSDYFLILGANPLVSNGSLLTAPGMRRRLSALKKRGAEVVVLDPRQSETARLASQHFFIRPGGDAFFLLALLHVFFRDQVVAPGRLRALSRDWDLLPVLVADFAPETVAQATGLSPAEITQIAHDFAAAPRAVCYGRIGTSTQIYGGLNAWLINLVNLVTGNFDRAGGAMFPRDALDAVALLNRLGQRGSFDRWRSRVQNLPEFGGEFPATTLADEIATPGPGQIKALITMAGNPVLSTPGGNRLAEVLPQLEFMVSLDIYRNETSSLAQIILPGTCGLERAHYELAGSLTAVRHQAHYAPALFAKGPEQRHDWENIRDLALKLAQLKGGKNRILNLARPLVQAFQPEALLDLLLRLGPYPLSLKKLRQYPHGLDLGPLEPCLPQRLYTPDRKIRLAPPLLVKDLKRLRQALQAAQPERQAEAGQSPDELSLHLIGRRHLRSNNSWMHNSPRLVKGRPACTLLIHPQDAERLGLQTGEKAELQSRVGRLSVDVELSNEIMPGVVSLPHGWGHHHPDSHLQVASARPGVSVNDITDPQLRDTLTGTAVLNGVPVRLRRPKTV